MIDIDSTLSRLWLKRQILGRHQVGHPRGACVLRLLERAREPGASSRSRTARWWSCRRLHRPTSRRTTG